MHFSVFWTVLNHVKWDAQIRFTSQRECQPFSHVVHGVQVDFDTALTLETHVEGDVYDIYKTSWFIMFEALSWMVMVRGSCDKPFKTYSRLENFLCEHPSAQIRDVIDL